VRYKLRKEEDDKKEREKGMVKKVVVRVSGWKWIPTAASLH